MTRHLLAVSLIALSSAVSAEAVSFQSGEHEGFTRLVATLPTAETEWQISGQGRTYTITVEGEDLSFDTDDIFKRIPRTRLQKVTTDPASGSVRLDLACDCVVESARFQNRHVIFDIRKGETEPQPLPFSFALNLPQETQKQSADIRYPTWASPTPVGDFSKPKPTLQPAINQTALGPVADPGLRFDIYARDNEQVSRIARQVIDQIDRAQDQNLLTGIGDEALEAVPDKSGKHTRWQTAQTGTEQDGPIGEDTHVTTYNALDMAAQEIAAVLAGRNGTSNCIADDRLDIEAWGGSEEFSTELGRLRSELVGEFDLTSSEAMADLAKFYIAQTFGTEALQILRNIPAEERDPALVSMAQLVEAGTITGVNAFAGQGHCASNAAFWAALSGQPLTGKAAMDGALTTLTGLPLPLREHLAPFLSNQLVENGHVEEAAMVLNSVQRTSPEQSPEFALAQAAVHAELGEEEEAVEKLEKVASENSSMAPAALVELIAVHTAQNRVVPDETVALVSALAVEHKAGMMGPQLRIAHARARMLSQDFESAFEVIDEIAALDGAVAALAPRSEVSRAVLNNAEDFDVIRFTVSERLSDPETLEHGTALSLAQRMLDLGFLDQTKRIVQAMRPELSSDDLHLLKARVALAENLPRRAEAELLSVDGAQADALRAQARSKAGDHTAAAEILRAMGDTEKAAFEAWLAGDASELSALQFEVYERIETMMASAEADEQPSAQFGELHKNRDLLNGSINARAVLTELLELHRISGPST